MSASSCFGIRRLRAKPASAEDWADSTTTLEGFQEQSSISSTLEKSSQEASSGQRRRKSLKRTSVRKPTAENTSSRQQQLLPTPPSSARDSDDDASGHRLPTPIAICGLALRLPGGIRDADAFWDALLNGRDMRGPIPKSRYNPVGFASGTTPPYGYFLEDDLAALDTSFFNLRKSELEAADPQQRQLLEVTRECLENAGETNYRGKSIGCYVGTFGEDWQHMMCKDEEHLESHTTSMPDLMLANRISYEYDLQGPRYARSVFQSRMAVS